MSCPVLSNPELYQAHAMRANRHVTNQACQQPILPSPLSPSRQVQWYERRANMPEHLQPGMHDREVAEWLQVRAPACVFARCACVCLRWCKASLCLHVMRPRVRAPKG